jgi:hypothetical protein
MSECEEDEGGRMSNLLVNPEATSVRVRYIRVAQIDIMVNEGTWNICVTEVREK